MSSKRQGEMQKECKLYVAILNLTAMKIPLIEALWRFYSDVASTKWCANST